MLPLRIACSTELRIKGRGRRDASLTNRGYDAHLVTLSRGRSSCQGRRLVCPTGKSGVTSSSRKSKIRRPTLSCGLRLRAENCFCFTKKSQIVSTRRCSDSSASDKGHRGHNAPPDYKFNFSRQARSGGGARPSSANCAGAAPSSP